MGSGPPSLDEFSPETFSSQLIHSKAGKTFSKGKLAFELGLSIFPKKPSREAKPEIWIKAIKVCCGGAKIQRRRGKGKGKGKEAREDTNKAASQALLGQVLGSGPQHQ